MIESDEHPPHADESAKALNSAEALLLQLRRIAAPERSATDWLLPMQESFRQVGELMRQVAGQLVPVAEALRPVFQAIASVDWDAWWNEKREVFLAAAKTGWFLQPEMSPMLVLDAEGALPSGFQERFVAELTAELSAIETRLVNSFPKREHLIREGFSLHREKRYYAAIPLFLNCAEGIVTEATNESSFNTSSKVPQVSKWTSGLPVERIDRLLAEALTVPHPFSQHADDGRHKINHGTSIDYGTELLSLKAISFLGFSGWLFSNEGPLVRAAKKAGWVHTARGWQAPRK